MRKLLEKLEQLLLDIEKAAPRSTTDDGVASAVRHGCRLKVLQLIGIWQPRLGNDSLQDVAANEDDDGFCPLGGKENPLNLPGPGHGPVIISL